MISVTHEVKYEIPAILGIRPEGEKRVPAARGGVCAKTSRAIALHKSGKLCLVDIKTGAMLYECAHGEDLWLVGGVFLIVRHGGGAEYDVYDATRPRGWRVTIPAVKAYGGAAGVGHMAQAPTGPIAEEFHYVSHIDAPGCVPYSMSRFIFFPFAGRRTIAISLAMRQVCDIKYDIVRSIGTFVLVVANEDGWGYYNTMDMEMITVIGAGGALAKSIAPYEFAGWDSRTRIAFEVNPTAHVTRGRRFTVKTERGPKRRRVA